MNGISGKIVAGVAALLALTAVSMMRQNAEEKKKRLAGLKKEYGKNKSRKLTADRLSVLRQYSDAVGGEGIDDITWNDCEFDRLYARFGHVFSAVGEEVLYSELRHPLSDIKELEKRKKKVDCFGSDEESRLRATLVFLSSGEKNEKGSVSVYRRISEANEGKGVPRVAALISTLMTVFSFALLFFEPVIAVFLLGASLVADIAVSLRVREGIKTRKKAVSSVLYLYDTGKAIVRLGIPFLGEEIEKISHLLSLLAPLKKKAVFIDRDGSGGGDIGELLLHYGNLLFHFDVFAFAAVEKVFLEHTKEATELYVTLGEIEACIAAASFRASLPYSADAEMSDEKLREAGFAARDIAHPLLKDPVPNTLERTGNILLTGSNASGKSTFLKTVATAAVTAQTFGFVYAKSYRAPFFRIYTSMALKDNMADNESYYVVELRSLKRIIEASERDDRPVLCMIDEILKGTNTVERIASSRAVLERLDRDNVFMLAATHDIELTEMLKRSLVMMHFEERMEGNDVLFDYKLKEGPAVTRNAIALMRTMGFDPAIPEKAERYAREASSAG